ncbi:hypothetical protein V3C99_018174 [Haemonchus contortus]
MERVIADGTKGSFYIGAVDTGSYLEFLRNAIRLKKELKEISQSQDIGSRKLLGAVRADLHLVRDYNVEALRYAQEHGLPKPDLLPLPYEELFSVNGHRHGHSHDHSIQLGYFQTEDVGDRGVDHLLRLHLQRHLISLIRYFSGKMLLPQGGEPGVLFGKECTFEFKKFFMIV